MYLGWSLPHMKWGSAADKHGDEDHLRERTYPAPRRPRAWFLTPFRFLDGTIDHPCWRDPSSQLVPRSKVPTPCQAYPSRIQLVWSLSSPAAQARSGAGEADGVKGVLAFGGDIRVINCYDIVNTEGWEPGQCSKLECAWALGA